MGRDSMSSDVAEGILSSARGGEGFFTDLGEGSGVVDCGGGGEEKGEVYGVEQPMIGGSQAREDLSHPLPPQNTRCPLRRPFEVRTRLCHSILIF